MATPQSGKKDLIFPGEALGGPYGDLVDLANPLMLWVWIPYFSRNCELSSLEGNWGRLGPFIPPSLHCSIPGHLVGLLVSGKTAMTRHPLERHMAGKGVQNGHNLPQSRGIF